MDAKAEVYELFYWGSVKGMPREQPQWDVDS